MSKKARNLTLIGLAAGLVLVPVIRAVIRRSKPKTEDEPLYEGAPPNHIFSAYRGAHKPHRRKKADDGAN